MTKQEQVVALVDVWLGKRLQGWVCDTDDSDVRIAFPGTLARRWPVTDTMSQGQLQSLVQGICLHALRTTMLRACVEAGTTPRGHLRVQAEDLSYPTLWAVNGEELTRLDPPFTIGGLTDWLNARLKVEMDARWSLDGDDLFQ